VEDAGERLVEALEQLQEIADEVTPDEAVTAFDDATLQVFWRDWTQVSKWGGAVWRLLNEDLDQPARPSGDSDVHEVGGEGG
jgi:hypothetical protein